MELDKIRIDRNLPAAVAGVGPLAGSSVDMLECDRVTFLCVFGNITDGTPGLKVQQSSDDGAADDWSDVEGSLVSPGLVDDLDMVAVEVVQPQKRYVRPYVLRGGSTGCEVNGLFSFQSDWERYPFSDSTDLVGKKVVHWAPEGTA